MKYGGIATSKNRVNFQQDSLALTDVEENLSRDSRASVVESVDGKENNNDGNSSDDDSDDEWGFV